MKTPSYTDFFEQRKVILGAAKRIASYKSKCFDGCDSWSTYYEPEGIAFESGIHCESIFVTKEEIEECLTPII